MSKEQKYQCPECYYIEDDQYTCTTCWSQGGQGTVTEQEAIDAGFDETLTPVEPKGLVYD